MSFYSGWTSSWSQGDGHTAGGAGSDLTPENEILEQLRELEGFISLTKSTWADGTVPGLGISMLGHKHYMSLSGATDLPTRINTVRAAYGLAAYSFSYSSPYSHEWAFIVELRKAVGLIQQASSAFVVVHNMPGNTYSTTAASGPVCHVNHDGAGNSRVQKTFQKFVGQTLATDQADKHFILLGKSAWSGATDPSQDITMSTHYKIDASANPVGNEAAYFNGAANNANNNTASWTRLGVKTQPTYVAGTTIAVDYASEFQGAGLGNGVVVGWHPTSGHPTLTTNGVKGITLDAFPTYGGKILWMPYA